MNEEEWLKCTDPDRMLDHLYGMVGDRKMRLFACACCRNIWGLLRDEGTQAGVNTAERFAEGLSTDEELAVAGNAVTAASLAARAVQAATNRVAVWSARHAAECAARSAGQASKKGKKRATAISVERQRQAVFLRCIFRRPFHPISIDPTWLTPTVLSLAQAAHDNRNLPSGTLDNARLGVLADALEDAGAIGAILEHLRSEGPHVCGCFALDLVLGKA
jgi:hypothetical protein